MTQVINLFGGSGLGKSTLAAGVFYKMKMQGIHCEMVREYVKQLAWDGIKVGPLDQPYLFGKQCKYESRLYNKVDYVVTDSPLLLSPFYEQFWTGDSIVLPSVLKFLEAAKKNGITHHNFFLTRQKKFDPRGRYETETQAIAADVGLKKFLQDLNVPFTDVTVADEDRADFIISELGV
jgi:hypothetical protein